MRLQSSCPVVLASASPRRRELLAALGIAFTVVPAEVDEIGAAAMREYLKRHPLRDEEKALFDKRIESKKS